mmetsp:Transcript_43812/g.79999  ORF Transcript_43812/g.79999 Transcript_43812/m.79999 type:complete len:161 (-) Transcript_43812:213-695(-)
MFQTAMCCRSCCQADDANAWITDRKGRQAGMDEEVVKGGPIAVPPVVLSQPAGTVVEQKDGIDDAAPSEYRVIVSKREGRLGIIIGYTDEDDAMARVTKVVDGSAVDDWNKQNNGRQVLVDYFILEVNGVTSAPGICDEIRRSEQVNLLVRRPSPEELGL